MSYKSPGSTIRNLQELDAETLPEKAIGVGDILSNPIILHKWRINYSPDLPRQFVSLFHMRFQAKGIRDSGAGAVNTTLEQSDDDVNYTTKNSLGFNTGAFVSKYNELGPLFDFNITQNFIRITLSNNDGATSGRIKQLKLTFHFTPGIGNTFTKII